MVKINSFVLAILVGTFSYAQEWLSKEQLQEPNFFEIQQEFETFWKDRPVEKGQGYKQFKRWEYFWEQRVSSTGEFPHSNINLLETKNYAATHKKNDFLQKSGATWAFFGTDYTVGGYAGIGRLNCIAFHPSLPNTFWVGSPAGGLWKTTDGGLNWTTTTDNLPVLGISDIVIDPTNPSIMYVATGDGDGNADTKSLGVLKSLDGGTTWTETGLKWSASNQRRIRRLLLDPTNADHLIAATNDGMYQTLDGGVIWSRTNTGWFMDVEFHPTDPTIAYASTYAQGGGAQIYRSINGGSNWLKVTNLSGVVRINLAVSPADPAQVQAVCVDTQYGLKAIYRSSDSGASFTSYLTGTSSNNYLSYDANGNGTGGQGWYDLAFTMNPLDADEVLLGGVNTWKTTDGGNNWDLSSFWYNLQDGTPTVHADKHFLRYNPLNGKLYECNDGGVYVSDDSGTNWTNITNGIGISQIYRIGVSGKSPEFVICGLQDNGTKELNGNSWRDVKGGDGMECIIDYSDDNIQYATYVYGQIAKSTNGGNSFNVIVENDETGVDERGNWVTPYVMHPSNPNTLLVGKSQVWQSTDQGSSWNQLGSITGLPTKITAMAYAPSDPQTIYVSGGSRIYKTTNNGGTWTSIKNGGNTITYIAVSPTNSNEIWITYSSYTSGNKVFTSVDGGDSWDNISGTLPNVPVNCIVYENGSQNALYIGTDIGVFYRDSTKSDWESFDNGLPNVVVNELEISYVNNKLWAATYGRGLWRSSLYPQSKPTSGFSVDKNSICPSDSVNYTDKSNNEPTSWLWTFAGGTPATSALQNPTNIRYEIAGEHDVTLIATNNVGSDTLVQTAYIVTAESPVKPIITVNESILTSSSIEGNKWYLDGNAIPNENQQMYTVLTNGEYVVRVTNDATCFTESDPLEFSSVGLTEIVLLQIKLYPNPTSGTLYIDLNSDIDGASVFIHDLNGKEVLSFVNQSSTQTILEINGLEKLTNGIYSIVIESGTVIQRGRFTVSRTK
jgi:PKD repeat protein